MKETVPISHIGKLMCFESLFLNKYEPFIIFDYNNNFIVHNMESPLPAFYTDANPKPSLNNVTAYGIRYCVGDNRVAGEL